MKNWKITIENFKHEKNRGFEFKNLNMVISQGDNIGIVGESDQKKYFIRYNFRITNS